MSTKTERVTTGGQKISTRAIAQVGMLAAIAEVLMFFEFSLPFVPQFYKLDFSEVPVLIGSFVMGPLAGVAIELIKVLLNALKTSTMGVGEFASFLIGCSFCLPAGLVYQKVRTRKGALIGMSLGTATMVVLGCFINAFVLLPFYASAFHMPMDSLLAQGSAVNPYINSLFTFVIFAVAPFNLLKGVLVSLVVFLIYKKISPILRMR